MMPRYSDFSKRAAAEVCSLLTEGYLRIAEIQRPEKGRGMVTLRHRANGNRISVRYSPSGLQVVKNGCLVKSEGFACLDVSI